MDTTRTVKCYVLCFRINNVLNLNVFSCNIGSNYESKEDVIPGLALKHHARSKVGFPSKMLLSVGGGYKRIICIMHVLKTRIVAPMTRPKYHCNDNRRDVMCSEIHL